MEILTCQIVMANFTMALILRIKLSSEEKFRRHFIHFCLQKVYFYNCSFESSLQFLSVNGLGLKTAAFSLFSILLSSKYGCYSILLNFLNVLLGYVWKCISFEETEVWHLIKLRFGNCVYLKCSQREET